MINKIIRGILTVFGAVSGAALYMYIINEMGIISITGDPKNYVIGIIISSLTSGIMLFIISPWLINQGREIANKIEKELFKVPTVDIVLGSVGLIIGLIISYLITNLITNIMPFPLLGFILSVLVYIFMSYLGIKVATKKTGEISNTQDIFKKNIFKERGAKKDSQGSAKVLDTSVIIDGRIADICRTGFVEGPLIIPGFVLEELRHIADSSDVLKRNRGRRGLDILNAIQKELDIEEIGRASCRERV